MAVKHFDVMSLGKSVLANPEQAGYQDSIDIIKDESLKVQKSFVKIGWYLKHIRDNELYKENGYASIWECAADQLGYSQSTASRFINICEKFSKDHNSPELDIKYAGFDKSQMIEMLPMEQEQLDKVTPDMTVKRIRDIKMEDKVSKEGQEQAVDDDIPGQTSIEKDFREYLPEDRKEAWEAEKLQEDEAEEIIDGEYREINDPGSAPEPEQQPELPLLTNNDRRKKWLENYKEWGLWYRDDNIDVNYYKYDFSDGSRLVVAEYPQRQNYWRKNKIEDEHYYHLLQVNKEGYGFNYDEKYRDRIDNMTDLMDFLRNLQKRI